MEFQKNEEGPNVKLEAKKVLFARCLKSILISLIVQVEMVSLFAIVINFNIFEPLTSIWDTTKYLSSVGTWVTSILLLTATFLYFILLQKYNLYPKKYHPTRAHWIFANIVPKSIFFILHMAVGYLTVFHISRYLHRDYQNLVNRCFDEYCFNNYYFFILCSALFMSFYYFFKYNATKDPGVQFPIIHERKLVQFRYLVAFDGIKILQSTIVPFFYFVMGYLVLGYFIANEIANFIGLESDEHMSSFLQVLTNLRLLIYTFMVMVFILTTFYLMQKFSSILLTEEVDFVIEIPKQQEDDNLITLVEALAMEDLPIMQILSAWHLYNICTSKNSTKRKEIFALTLIGGHPNNWNALADTSLSLIRSYTNKLHEATDKSRILKNSWYHPEKLYVDDLKEQKKNLRRFNKSRGIRILSDEEETVETFSNQESASGSSNQSSHSSQSKSSKDVSADAIDKFSLSFYQRMNRLWNHFFQNFPGIRHFFGEAECARVNFLLAESQNIIWLIQGLAGICSASKVEDTYGVVQETLPDVISTLLRLKLELEKLNNFYLIGKEMDGHYRSLIQAVKRSLYKICDAFGEYMQDLLTDPAELRQIQSFLAFQVI